jgi:Tol biopolymer transport system component
VANGNSYQGELFKYDPRRKAFQTILHGLSASYLSFSKDGQWMTYLSNGDNCLWRSRVDGTEALQLTKPPFEVQLSAWSPDGRRIAFMGKHPGKLWRIYLINRDGGAMEEAATGTDNQGAPSWSPDGKMLAYGNVLCEEAPSCSIWRINLGTKSEEILPDSRGFRTARWSPDGKYIAALQRDNHQLMLFDVAQKRWTTLAGSIAGDNLNWSSDSQYVYADSPHGENPVIERIRITDGKCETVASLSTLQKTIGQADFWFGLAPDGSPILGHRFIGSEVYVLNWADQ